ncbi:glycosyltransferase family 2 protein [Jeotgalibacillus salarius]|uniref:Glycosyltransferase n=1 Tax=Jeotgalibacillus salarius TaxID=546023 RepID=A0A4Y8LGC2_9BACL|nr:glycosyltransferase [Jeotgalibacillus salarius]TFE01706.1 glycosyltransferase [Jeotgalibacillus salarius]
MKVSVIIPVYNVEKYLDECIKSVLKQDYHDMEILLINDGSTDNSLNICREYEQAYASVRVIDQPNKGLSGARNTGILEAKGKYLIFLDSDDYWGMNFMSELADRVIENPGLDYVFFRFKFYHQKKNKFDEPYYPLLRKKVKGKKGMEGLAYILEEMKHYNWFAWCGLVKRSFLLEHRLFFIEKVKYEDVFWTPNIFLNAEQIDFYDAPVYVYRLEREGQITSNLSFKNLSDSLTSAVYWNDQVEKENVSAALKEKLLINTTNRYFYALYFAGFLSEKEQAELIQMLKNHRHLTRYRSSGISTVSSFMCRTIGFKATTSIIKYSIMLKQKKNTSRLAV